MSNQSGFDFNGRKAGARLAFLALLFCLLPASLEARQPRLVEVLTYPPGARITDQYNNFLGTSGEKVAIEPSYYSSENLELHFVLEGYEPHKHQVGNPGLVERIPSSGIIPLVPKNVWVRARDYVRFRPWLPPLTLLTIVGIVVFGKRRRARDLRLQKLEKYGGAVATDSLVMQTLGGYRLVDILGQGGMATVYRGLPEDTLDESKPIAVKVLSRQLVESQEHIDRFRREANLCRSLSHPGLIKILDWGDDGERYFWLAMELVEGTTLRQRMVSQRLGDRQAREILEVIYAAVGHAHQLGITHRDLKPENIMLTPDGRPKVMDFGLAKADDSANLTATGVALGTPAYMAPEQLRTGSIGPACDQYALGLITYEFLTGCHPFANDETTDIFLAQLTLDPPPPSQVRRDLDPALDPVILRMLNKEPEQRFPNLEEAWSALEQVWKIA